MYVLNAFQYWGVMVVMTIAFVITAISSKRARESLIFLGIVVTSETLWRVSREFEYSSRVVCAVTVVWATAFVLGTMVAYHLARNLYHWTMSRGSRFVFVFLTVALLVVWIQPYRPSDAWNMFYRGAPRVVARNLPESIWGKIEKGVNTDGPPIIVLK